MGDGFPGTDGGSDGSGRRQDCGARRLACDDIVEVGGESGPDYLRVKTGDLDGDGRADEAVVKLLCADGKLQQALLRREPGIGSPTERRQYAPVKIVKEWGAPSPQLMALKPTTTSRI